MCSGHYFSNYSAFLSKMSSPVITRVFTSSSDHAENDEKQAKMLRKLIKSGDLDGLVRMINDTSVCDHVLHDENCLINAASYGQLHIVDYILTCSNPPPFTGSNVAVSISMAADRGHDDVVVRLMKDKCFTTLRDNSKQFLQNKVAPRHDLVKRLLEESA